MGDRRCSSRLSSNRFAVVHFRYFGNTAHMHGHGMLLSEGVMLAQGRILMRDEAPD